MLFCLSAWSTEKMGIIGRELFAILVVMAIVTTLMATPIFEWVYGSHARKCADTGSSGIDG